MANLSEYTWRRVLVTHSASATVSALSRRSALRRAWWSGCCAGTAIGWLLSLLLFWWVA